MRKQPKASPSKKFQLPANEFTIVSPSAKYIDHDGNVTGIFYGRALMSFGGRIPPEIRAMKVGGKWFTEETNEGITHDLDRQFTTGKIFP